VLPPVAAAARAASDASPCDARRASTMRSARPRGFSFISFAGRDLRMDLRGLPRAHPRPVGVPPAVQLGDLSRGGTTSKTSRCGPCLSPCSSHQRFLSKAGPVKKIVVRSPGWFAEASGCSGTGFRAGRVARGDYYRPASHGQPAGRSGLALHTVPPHPAPYREIGWISCLLQITLALWATRRPMP